MNHDRILSIVAITVSVIASTYMVAKNSGEYSLSARLKELDIKVTQLETRINALEVNHRVLDYFVNEMFKDYDKTLSDEGEYFREHLIQLHGIKTSQLREVIKKLRRPENEYIDEDGNRRIAPPPQEENK